MEGDRGVLVTQEVLTEQLSKRKLSHTLLRLSTEQLHWACVVFTESMLRARVPLHLTLLPETPTDKTKYLVIALACTGTVFIGLLLGALLFHRMRRANAGKGDSNASDGVYSTVSDVKSDQGNSTSVKEGTGGSSTADAIYSNTTDMQKVQVVAEGRCPVVGTLQFVLYFDDSGKQRRQSSSDQEQDAVVYSSIKTT
ncbi:hypothetical protein AGOR_G00218750 [Albula goreensis]|uniref:Uncharacterized protein n=1 Tax=Albula goreensis TaxID=1534307 RepID=A0A8T3CP55_9TELE|nr:hypothetical protein AGOR_G00218750 [Albula goreensis]